MNQGAVSADLIEKGIRQIFTIYDTNNDGKLSIS